MFGVVVDLTSAEVQDAFASTSTRREKRGRGEVGTVAGRSVGGGGRAGEAVGALLEGQRHELPAAEGLLSGLPFGALLADKGFDGDGLRKLVSSLGAEAVVPPKSNRKEAIAFDEEKYKRRHRVENFFCRIKRATRYDQTESSYAAMIRVVAIRLALA